jgi:UDP:flavonoid glycosyltransferase YjiC (YdhE family)
MRVASTIRHVLTDPSFTTNARRISEKMQTYGGASEAAHLIGNFWEKRHCDIIDI